MFNKKKIASAIALSAIGASALTVAPVVTAEGITLEEIVVTAQKREQNLQEVPVSVTAFGGVQLEQTGVQTIADLERVTPNATLRPSRATNTTLTAYIRGIGQNDPLWGFEPGVGLYIDDIYFARPQGAMLDVYDIERIEVLRGPQGSLYGKNTIGGAIKYVTKRMTGDSELGIKLGYGSYNQNDVTVTGQLPVIQDKLYIGASIASFERDGYGENLLTGEENYNKEMKAARLSVEFNPTEDIFIRLAGDITEDDSNNKHGNRLVPSNVGNADVTAAFDTWAGAPATSSVENEGVNLIVEWDISEELTFKSITATREGSTKSWIDFDAGPQNVFDAPVSYSDEQFTQEFQLNYTTDNLAIVGGLYYLDGEADGSFDAIAGEVLYSIGLDGVFGPAQGGAVLPEDAGTTFVAYTAGDAETESMAAYVHASYNISDSWTVTVGGRYTQDEKEASVFKAKYVTADGPSAAYGGTNLLTLATQSDFTEGDDWSKFSPKIGADWKVNDDVMIYASIAEGFKSGGVNMRADHLAAEGAYQALPDVADDAVLGTDYHVFDPEEARSYELGAKLDVLDGRVRINTAVFYTEYTAVQITTNRLLGDNFVPTVTTNNEQTIAGMELELNAQLTESLSTVFNLGYIDASWDEFVSNGAPLQGVQVSNTPDLTGFLGLNYDADLGNAGSIVFSGGVSYTSEITMEVTLPDQPIDQDDYTLVNLSGTWYSANENWTVALHGKNLTNRHYRVAGYNFAAFLGDDEITGFYGDPRTVTLNVGYKF